ncbi:uncharacterized protein LOC127787828 [Diospyros lotus]|uniref:uncharacterized protein LOC127787828 n=1 Tax=Diospyros lotus TaxID=55363 RepID=UPI002258F9DA|nr:uncharacterized protein LOC127787828 [Diospyros lotus]
MEKHESGKKSANNPRSIVDQTEEVDWRRDDHRSITYHKQACQWREVAKRVSHRLRVPVLGGSNRPPTTLLSISLCCSRETSSAKASACGTRHLIRGAHLSRAGVKGPHLATHKALPWHLASPEHLGKHLLAFDYTGQTYGTLQKHITRCIQIKR